ERSTATLWGWAHRYVRKGGHYVVADGRRRPTQTGARMPDWASGVPSSLTIKDWQAIAPAKASAAEYVPLADGLAVTQGAHYLRVATEADARNDGLVPRLKHTQVDTLASLDATHVTALAKVDHHQPRKAINKVDTKFWAPEMTLRHYTGEVRFHGHMAFSAEDTLLPHSFRYPWSTAARREIPGVVGQFEDNNLFLLKDADEAPWLPPGDYVDLTHPFSGHFGHVIAQGLARTWGWSRALEKYPDARVILQRRWNREEANPTNGFSILQNAGIPENRIEWVSGPVRVESLIVPSLGLQYTSPLFIHPVVEQTFHEMRERIVHEDAKLPRRIFVSRVPREGNRACMNTPRRGDLP
ncbi:MAG: hypothetical protein QM607_06085, partial [Microbacterium sp.]